MPVGHECLSTGFMRENGTHLFGSLYVMKRLNMRSSGAVEEGGEGMALKI